MLPVEIFAPSDVNQQAFVEKSQEIVQKVNSFIMSKKGALPLLDPLVDINQCHLFALKAAKMFKEHREPDRLMHRIFFLSHSLRFDAANFRGVVEKAMKELNIQLKPKEAKPFKQFLLDEGRPREEIVRRELIEEFKTDLSAALKKEDTPLYRELARLSQEEKLYTFPKFAGVVYFVDQIAKENIPFVVKVKVLTPQGAAGVEVLPSRPIEDGEPVIVFEGFATDGTKSLPKCMEEAKKCPTYFHRHFDARKLHPAVESCFYCQKTEKSDLVPYRERLQKVMASPKELLYALGADFVIKQQKPLQHFFEDQEKYPLLSALFSAAKEQVDKLGVDMDKPTTFSVCHAYADDGVHAKSPALQLDMTKEAFLKSRGLL